MGSIGYVELLIIAGLALVLLGPDKFPQFFKIFFRTLRDLRGYMNDVKREITAELRPVEREIQQLTRVDPETYIDALVRGDLEESGPRPAAGGPATSAEPPAATTAARGENAVGSGNRQDSLAETYDD